MDNFVSGFSRPEFGMLASLWYSMVAHDQYRCVSGNSRSTAVQTFGNLASHGYIQVALDQHSLELGILASREKALDSSMLRGVPLPFVG